MNLVNIITKCSHNVIGSHPFFKCCLLFFLKGFGAVRKHTDIMRNLSRSETYSFDSCTRYIRRRLPIPVNA
jgi:hypothetical protein